MRVIALSLSPRYQLFSETTPRTIVGTEGTGKVIFKFGFLLLTRAAVPQLLPVGILFYPLQNRGSYYFKYGLALVGARAPGLLRNARGNFCYCCHQRVQLLVIIYLLIGYEGYSTFIVPKVPTIFRDNAEDHSWYRGDNTSAINKRFNLFDAYFA
jgi:hypothetical protein